MIVYFRALFVVYLFMFAGDVSSAEKVVDIDDSYFNSFLLMVAYFLTVSCVVMLVLGNWAAAMVFSLTAIFVYVAYDAQVSGVSKCIDCVIESQVNQTHRDTADNHSSSN